MGLERLGETVFEPEQKLRHLPFFEEVASHAEGEAAWRSATAGLVVLRLVDAWLENGRSVVADDGWSARSVRAAIQSMDDATPIRSILESVLDALHEQKPDVHVVVTPLMAYGRALEFEGKWALASDVYHAVLSHLHPNEDSDAVIAANLRLGQCYRTLNMIDAASSSFVRASAVAETVGDIVGVLRAQIGEARLSVLRGNYPRADELLKDAVARSDGPALRDVRSRALHDQSGLASNRGDYELAVKLGYEALDCSESQSERDRILGDIALAFMRLGVYSAARDAYLILSVVAQEQYTRWMAQLNLVDIATETGAEILFEQYRREFDGQKLPPFIATALEVSVGRGLHRFGYPEAARRKLSRAVLMATEHQLNAVLITAEEALEAIEKATPPSRRSNPVPLDLEEVASAIRELRLEVGVS